MQPLSIAKRLEKNSFSDIKEKWSNIRKILGNFSYLRNILPGVVHAPAVEERTL